MTARNFFPKKQGCRQTPRIRVAISRVVKNTCRTKKIHILNQNLCVYDSAILLKYHS